jgi:hypothetical protein
MNHYSYGLACFIAKLGWASVFIYLWIMALGWLDTPLLWQHIPFMIFTAITIISSIVVFFGKQDINV